MIVSKAKTTLTIMFILLSALLWAARPALRPCSGCTQAMKRESAAQPAKIEIALSLDEALSRSLAMGDGRRVNWGAVGF